MQGRYERMGRRIALILFLSLSAAFVVSTVAQYTTLVFWPNPPVARGACRDALAKQYAALSEASRTAQAAGDPNVVEIAFLAATADFSSPATCEGDPRGIEASRALIWLRIQVGERLGRAARTDTTVRNELVKAYLSDVGADVGADIGADVGGAP